MLKFKINLTPFVLMLALSSFFMACSTRVAHQRHSRTNEYQVRQGDVIEVKFDYYSDFDQTVIVGPNGKTSFRDIDELQIKNLTVSELRQNLIKEYSEMLAAPNLQVKVHASSKFSIYVGGHIKKPGMVKFKKDLNIVQGILLAGGLKDKLQRNYEIFVFRNRGKEGVKMYKFEIGAKAGSKVASRNFQLAPYDVVFIMKSKTSRKKARTLI